MLKGFVYNGSNEIMNLPNRLTVSRLVLTLAFLAALFTDSPIGDTAALVIFVVAGLTDYYDGKIARRDKLITNFGILMDPLADKILICSAFIAFVGRGLVPAWMVVIIVARELAITGLRMLAASKQVVLAAEGFGKHKTASQIVAIVATLLLVGYPAWGAFGKVCFAPWIEYVKIAAIWLAVVLTIFSGGMYLWRNREIYTTDL